jgi:hypothetical protein
MIFGNSTTIDKENNNNNNNNFILACNISIIVCLDNNSACLRKIES